MTDLSKSEPSPLSKHLTAINTKTEYTFDPDVKDYPAFVVNRCLSYHPDCIFWCNDLNELSTVSDQQHYDYLFHKLRKRKRFAPWAKPEKSEKIDAVMRAYGYSRSKAIDALKILTDEQVTQIMKLTDRGGKV